MKRGTGGTVDAASLNLAEETHAGSSPAFPTVRIEIGRAYRNRITGGLSWTVREWTAPPESPGNSARMIVYTINGLDMEFELAERDYALFREPIKMSRRKQAG